MRLNLLTATLLVEKTMPCTLNKLAVYFGASFAYFASTLAGAGVGLIVYAFGIRSGTLANILAVVGFIVCAYIFMKIRGTKFVPVRTGHLRVLLEQADSKETLARKVQLQHAKSCSEDYFSSVKSLAVLERNIRGVLGKFYAQRLDIQKFAFSNAYLEIALNRVLHIAVAFIAEPILAYAIKQGKKGTKTASQHALGIFIQNIDTYARQVLLLNIFMYAAWIFFSFVMLFPINWVFGMLPFTLGLWNIVFAILFAWAIKAAIVESIAVSAFIAVFVPGIEEQQVSAEINQQIIDASNGYFS